MPIVQKLEKVIFWAALAFIIYMPLHVFIVQSASLLTGGLDIWKAAKDVLLVVSVPLLLYMTYLRGLHKNIFIQRFLLVGGLYTLLHGLFVIFDSSNDTYSSIVGSVYNTRILGYLLLGFLIGSVKNGELYAKQLITAAAIVAFLVSVFGVAQYFLPTDILEYVGYSIDRGVKPLFFIDGKPDLPRVMSTLKDPNSFGAYLIVPILFTGFAFLSKQANRLFFVRPFRRSVLGFMFCTHLLALFFTFSRGAVLGLLVSIIVLTTIEYGKQTLLWLIKNWKIVMFASVLAASAVYATRDTYLFKNIIFHADEATIAADPNEQRLILYGEAIDNIAENPYGYGPGSAGIVSINNPASTILTENYYLQIVHETGWLGLALYATIIGLIIQALYKNVFKDKASAVIFAALAGYLFYSLLIHLWSNETISLQWWLLAGISLGIATIKAHKKG